MKTPRKLLAFTSLFLVALAVPLAIPQVSGATGLVCITDPAVNPSTCPASPASFTGTAPANITIAVNIQGSDTVNGFDISILVDPSVLQPVGILTGSSIIHSPNMVVAQSVDPNTGIARLAMVAIGYSIAAPVTGNLFNVVYRVLTSTRGTGIVFQTGCSGTSVPNTCVTITSPNVDSETVQNGSLTGPVTVDFVVSSSQKTQTLTAGSSTFTNIVLNSLNGFSGVVNLSTTSPPLCPSCPTWSIVPTSVSLTSGGAASANFTFHTTTSTPPGTYNAIVNGTSGSLKHAVGLSFTVTAPPTPDFAMTASPTSQSVKQGSNATSTITLTSVNGFSGTVNLNTSPAPICVSCPTWTTIPTSLSLTSGGSATATFVFHTSLGTPTGTYTPVVNASSGSLSHTVSLFFLVVSGAPDFSISASPSSQVVQPGTNATSSITVTSLNGFSGTVNLATSPNLACPNCPGWRLSLTSVFVTSGGTALSTLTFTTLANGPTGTFNVNVTGTSGSLTHTTVASFTVRAAALNGTVCIAAFSPSTCPSKPVIFQGTVGSLLEIAVNVQNSSALNGFDIRVLTDPTILRPLNDSLGGTVLQNVLVAANSVNATSGLVHVAAVQQGGLTVAPTTGRLFFIEYNITRATTGTFILFPTGCSGTSNDSVCVTVTNPNLPGGIVPENILDANFTAPSPDFGISANPSSLAIPAGTTASSTVTITSINGFSGTVALTTCCQPLIICPPACSSWSISPASVTLSPGGSAKAILSITVGILGGSGSNITVTGTSGALSHSTHVVFTVVSPPPTFSLTANPLSITIRAGESGTSTLTISSLNGFNGTVSLSASIQPVLPKKNPVISLAPTSIVLASGGTATALLSISTNGGTATGTYTVTVTATSGSITMTTTITVTILPRH